MTRDEYDHLLAMIAKMAAEADDLQRTLEKIAKAERDPRRHAMCMHLHNVLRDSALALGHALADPPALTAAP
jgi:hypothetical protein